MPCNRQGSYAFLYTFKLELTRDQNKQELSTSEFTRQRLQGKRRITFNMKHEHIFSLKMNLE